MAAMMVVSMASVAAVAAGASGNTITVTNADTHVYDVYQILTGDLSNGKDTLSNVHWGSGAKTPDTNGKINGQTATEFAKSLEGLSGADLVAAVEAVKADSTSLTVSKDSPLSGQPTGYYMMVDTTGPLTYKDNSGTTTEETKALNVILLVDDVNVTVKWGTTENDKKIITDTLSVDSGTDPNTYASGTTNNNVSIGDTVGFELTAKVPENASEFTSGTFFFVITDKLSAGLTFTDGSIVVLDGKGNTLAENTNYTLKQPGGNGNTFEIGIINAASYEGQTLKVQYKAVLNENAVIGDAGNPNTSKVEYSNNPNKTYSGTPTDENYPGFPDSTKDVPTGVTPEKETKTYSTGIEIQKVDENGEPLTGATFEVSGQSAKLVVTKSEAFVVDAEGTYYKLKDGTYTMTAPTEGNTMKPAEAGATKGYVVDDGSTAEGTLTIDGHKYRPYVKETDAGKTIYVLELGSKDAYESTTTKYKKTTETVAQVSDPTAHKASMAVGANGLARFDGLGAGQYTITETVTPDGYNTIDPVNVTVTYNANGSAKFSVSGSATYEDGVIKVRMVNKKGGLLPETGGIGTTIFYVAGSILVLAAAILLVTKRRMGAND